jgi:hypothetical protein
MFWHLSAFAYPSSVIFAPTGEALPFGEGSSYAYVPVNLNPSVAPAATWIGLDYGIVPSFAYGSGLAFGGLELGLDLISGATHPNGTEYAKIILNAKANVLAQTDSAPALGIGLMSFAPFRHKESVNLTYLAATKDIQLYDTPVGTITLGLGYALGAKAFAFQGSPPFRESRWALLAGYVTPEWNRLSIAIDSVGGISETSATSAALNFSATETSYLMLGAYFTNDRSLPQEDLYDGVFVTIGVTIPSPTSPP